MKTTRPLWQTLAEAAEPGQTITLTCDECFQILEALAEAAAAEADPHGLRRAARRHLAHCPDCRDRHLQRLSELEAKLAGQSKHAHAPELNRTPK